MNGLLTEEEWKNKLRKSRNDFFYLVDLLKPDIEADANAIRYVLSAEKKVAVTLYYLKDQGSYRMTCNTFSCIKSCVQGNKQTSWACIFKTSKKRARNE